MKRSTITSNDSKSIGFDKSELKQSGLVQGGCHLPYNPELVARAKELRKRMTKAEKKLWHGYLRDFRYRFLRQRPIDHFIVDFYCSKLRLVIEVDGETHFTEVGKGYDAERTTTLEGYGLKVLRFCNTDVINNLQGVAAKIEETVKSIEKDPPCPPLNKGGGRSPGGSMKPTTLL